MSMTPAEHVRDNQSRGILFIISGPAGSGKTTVCSRLLKVGAPKLQRVLTTTTRPMRDGEVNGEDYLFFTVEQFEAEEAAGGLYETATVHGNRYGTLRSQVDDKLKAGYDLLLNIDVQGAASYRRIAASESFLRGRVATVFIMPPSLEEIRRRMETRGTDDEATIQRRLKTAEAEMALWNAYDYCILSGDRDEDFTRMRHIYEAESYRVR